MIVSRGTSPHGSSGTVPRPVRPESREPVKAPDTVRPLAVALPAALALLAGAALGPSAHAARTDVALGMVLEPPNLDPTAGAAGGDRRDRLRQPLRRG